MWHQSSKTVFSNFRFLRLWCKNNISAVWYYNSYFFVPFPRWWEWLTFLIVKVYIDFATKPDFCITTGKRIIFLWDGGIKYFDMKQDPFLENGDLILFGDGDQVVVSTEGDHIRFLLISGKPIGEPVAWYGPIIMNTPRWVTHRFWWA